MKIIRLKRGLTTNLNSFMLKYKIAGAVNLFLGFLQITISLSLLFFTLPKLREFYSEFNVETLPYGIVYFVLGLVLLMGLTNLLLGFKLILKTGEIKEFFFQYSIGLIIISFILCGLLVGFAVSSVLFPLYSLAD